MYRKTMKEHSLMRITKMLHIMKMVRLAMVLM